jgi:hypothetical protein
MPDSSEDSTASGSAMPEQCKPRRCAFGMLTSHVDVDGYCCGRYELYVRGVNPLVETSGLPGDDFRHQYSLVMLIQDSHRDHGGQKA